MGEHKAKWLSTLLLLPLSNHLGSVGGGTLVSVGVSWMRGGGGAHPRSMNTLHFGKGTKNNPGWFDEKKAEREGG